MYLYTLRNWGATLIYYANIRNVGNRLLHSAGFQRESGWRVVVRGIFRAGLLTIRLPLARQPLFYFPGNNASTSLSCFSNSSSCHSLLPEFSCVANQMSTMLT